MSVAGRRTSTTISNGPSFQALPALISVSNIDPIDTASPPERRCIAETCWDSGRLRVAGTINMYPSSHHHPQHPGMAPPQQRSVQPETFLLNDEAQQSLPSESVVALQQVDNRRSWQLPAYRAVELTHLPVKYFLISAPVDWSPDQYIRRFLLPTGEYVSCVLWYASRFRHS